MQAKTRLSAFVVLSIGTHALFAWTWYTPKQDMDWARPGQIMVSVQTAQAKQHQYNNQKNNTSDKKTKSRAPVSANKQPVQAVPEQSHSQHETSSTRATNLKVQLQGKIKSALQKHLTYPSLARRRGWQGTVTVRLLIQANGELNNVALTKSSGYALLDESAVSALRKVKQLRTLVPLLQGQDMSLELPITYRLTEANYGTPSV